MAVTNIQFTEIEIRIVKFIFKHYQERFNARQLAKILEINHAHANNLCKGLVKKNLLSKEDIGNAVYFTFNYKNKEAANFMVYLLSLEEQEFPKHLAVLQHNLKKFELHIQLGIVFGSSIKNKNFNDIDILLMYESDKKEEVDKIKEEIRKSQLIEKPIRYVDITENDIIVNSKEKVFYNILSNSLIFHNPEKYVEVIKKCHRLKTI